MAGLLRQAPCVTGKTIEEQKSQAGKPRTYSSHQNESQKSAGLHHGESRVRKALVVSDIRLPGFKP